MSTLYVLSIVVLFQVILTGLVAYKLQKWLNWKLAKQRRILNRRVTKITALTDEILDHSIEAKVLAAGARETAEAAKRESESISARFDRGEKPLPIVAGETLHSFRKRSEDRFASKINQAKAVVRGQETSA